MATKAKKTSTKKKTTTKSARKTSTRTRAAIGAFESG